MSGHFIAPPISNIFILDFACTTMFELLVGLSNLMFATENRKSRATTFPRIELCVRARCCYGLLCCHFPSSRSLKNLRFNSDMSELIISIIQDFLIAIKPLEYRDELSCLSTKFAEFPPSEYYTVYKTYTITVFKVMYFSSK